MKKKRTTETIPGKEKGGLKENVGGSEFNYDML
jgi:hypothetical protein